MTDRLIIQRERQILKPKRQGDMQTDVQTELVFYRQICISDLYTDKKDRETENRRRRESEKDILELKRQGVIQTDETEMKT